MLIPSKFTKVEDSILFKSLAIIENKVEGENIADIVRRTRQTFDSTSDLISALDSLFVIGALDIDLKTGVVCYAKQDLVRSL